MEPPVSYPQSDSYQGRQVYGRKSGCGKFGCFGVIGGIIVIVVIIIIGYVFVYPALTPNSISGSMLDMAIVPGKDGKQKVWMLTDGSFNFIQTTKSPGRTSTGRECYFCKTWTYIIDPQTEDILSKTKTPYEDVITTINMVYNENDGRVWTFTYQYGENQPKIEAFDAVTGEIVMNTKQFEGKFPDLSAGIAEVNYSDDDRVCRLKTTDGRERIFNLDDGKLYKDFSEMTKEMRKDSTIITSPFLVSDESSSGPRKKLIMVTGPKVNVKGNESSFTHLSIDRDYQKKYNGITIAEPLDKVYLEGIMYHKDEDCAIIIHLDKLGKVSDRLITCIDLKTGKEMWTIQPKDMFKEMKIDEEDDTFSSLFFTKDKIGVKRRGDLVVLQLRYEGIIGYDFKTGKKLFEIDA